ncbi:natural killer cell receptor 2B4-like [Carcharodon carcharias]|uniref:natural killer cell receptor 2B4-like n=1 Tax=Carcharodon carcharias TaxID=13397 RepID=UPI001B7DA6E6|nr:natural killer cell receptor 2B4-like [Carcharodon carcharias]
MANKIKKQIVHNTDMRKLVLFNMKIWALLSVFHLLTLCETEISAVAKTTINAIVGEQVLFPVHNQCGAQYEITLVAKSPIHAKLASWGFNTFEKHAMYENRLQRSMNDSVMLQNVQINDTKLYGIQVDCYSRTVTETSETLFDLQVFEPVSKPLITINCSATIITLSCSVSRGTNVTFLWEKSLSGAINTADNGAELVLGHVSEHEQYLYRCIGENPVSNASSDPSIIKQCNRKNAKDRKELHLISAAIVWLLALILFVFICYKVKRTARNKASNTATQMRNEEITYLKDGAIEATYITIIDSS